MIGPLTRLARTFAAAFNCAAVALLALAVYGSARGPASGLVAPQAPGPSVERMVGQMLMVGFKGTAPGQAWPRLLREQIAAGRIGGVLFLKQNIRNKLQLSELTSFLLDSGGETLPFLAVDQEGGRVQRLSHAKGFRRLPSPQALGRRSSPPKARRIYGAAAAQLAEVGFNLNLAPVVDLGLNPANPVVGRTRRTYSRDPKVVAAFARAFVEAHHSLGVATALKHFPGHGSSRRDSHRGPVDITGTWKPAELVPFRALIEAGLADMVMVGHLGHRGFTPRSRAPFSLAEGGIAERLRGELGYNGVVVTDDLEMGAIRRRYSLEEAVVRAIRAGNDLLLISNRRKAGRDLPKRLARVVAKAVSEGRISRARLRASYRRIVALKTRIARWRAATLAAATPAQTATARATASIAAISDSRRSP